MNPDRITTIFFDVGRTIRKTIPSPDTRSYWLEKIITTMGLDWTAQDLSDKLTKRLQNYKTWSEISLIELKDYELWRTWLLPDAAENITHINAPDLTQYSRKAIGEGILLPHAIEVIKELFNRGYRLGIISNTLSSEQTPDFLKEMELTRYFEAIVLSCNFGKKKPDPSIFTEATTQLGVNPFNCAYVGDKYDRDIIGSSNANFPISVLIEHTDSPTEVLPHTSIRPTHIITDLTELLDIFPPFYTVHKNGHKPEIDKLEKRFWNVSLSTMWSYERKISIGEMPEIINEMSILGVELNHSITTDHLSGLNLGTLPITSIHEPCPSDVSTATLTRKDWLISSESEENRCQGVRMMMRSIDLAVNVGASLVIVHPGNSGVGNHHETKLRDLYNRGLVGSPEYHEQFEKLLVARKSNLNARMNATEKSLKELLDYAGRSDIKLSLENRYHFMDIPTLDEMDRLLLLGDEDRIGMQFDVGHAIVMDRLGFMPFNEWLERFGTRIFGVHLHDVRGLEDHFAPGLGNIDFDILAKYIPSTAIRTLEIRGNNSEDEIRRGMEILNKAGVVNYKN